MPTPDDTADAHRKRAEEVVQALAAGANLGEETLKLSNEFTDAWTSRIAAKLKRIFRR
ncbi:hypothetical protein QMG83_03920 [Salinibacterium sp. G-O1]|uniref:hypothetical protein n=1 Tax=Salinibacterium sp. G-O1 TaxID=3046208 RepID=UPI0024BAD8C8|nr:hypothetical protein [Salinibacterium sp. G-O1]MDJ0334363.1 hypothetical protein [Salinibacterium sp. G-O1]